MKFNRKKKIKPFLIVVLIMIIGALYFGNNTVGVSRYQISTTRLPAEFNNFKILQLSDLHSKQFGRESWRLIRIIDKEEPDIIVMTGDMVNTSDENYDVFYQLSADLAKRYKLYYIAGNHEQILMDYRIIQFLNSNGITVLDNEGVKIEKGNDHINLYGLWFNLKYYKDRNDPYTKDLYYDLDTMQETLGSSNSNEYNILLTHNPMYFTTYAKWGADLTLSGHVHGGIVMIPFKGGLLSPERDFFPEYYGGIYSIEDRSMIVNRGLGNGNFGIRVFNKPEISVITLSNK
ncbi:MAG TPA: metallophosphoesterase [Desulfitobacterium dehalogenans]|uniref:Metallophosphoesterase n=1 Tax=Desulfitobacterium dehalogenans TaxID=36854 RepID=A0A7C7D3R1_9FIRM|nr:metallophosphoesterase [Desulfitobacterium dehalogenans]